MRVKNQNERKGEITQEQARRLLEAAEGALSFLYSCIHEHQPRPTTNEFVSDLEAAIAEIGEA